MQPLISFPLHWKCGPLRSEFAADDDIEIENGYGYEDEDEDEDDSDSDIEDKDEYVYVSVAVFDAVSVVGSFFKVFLSYRRLICS